MWNELNITDLVVIHELMEKDFTISQLCCIAVIISYVRSVFIAFQYSSFLVDDVASSLFDRPFVHFTQNVTLFVRNLCADFA
jgi:hypothetical protein